MKNLVLSHVIGMTRLFTGVFLIQLLSLNYLFAWNNHDQIMDIEDVMVTVSFNDTKIDKAFTAIEKMTGFSFVYADKVLFDSPLVTARTEEKSAPDLLKTNGQQTGLDYKLVNQRIHVRKVGNVEVPSPYELNVPMMEIVVSGTVTDVNGDPIPGATVAVPGTTIGTATDLDGKYSLSIPEGSSLVFSFIGFEPQTIEVGTQSIVDIVLEEDISSLDEVIVVGYGVQKKMNLTGSVDQVTSEAIEGRNVGNLTQSLQGLMPNVNITPLDGKPIQSPAINIRGTGSIGQGGNALVLIDGVEGDPSMVNPNDVESVSVLKDAASAAIYGARGVFGVVLITTKTPKKDVVSVTYSGNYGIKSPVVSPDFVTDGFTFANMFNDIFFARDGLYPQNINKTQTFSQEYLAELKRRSEDPSLPKTDLDEQGNYVYYHNTDWYGHLLKNSFSSTEHNVSVSGGTEKSSFMLSGRYSDQGGLFRYSTDKFKMYNLRAKGSIEVTPWLQVNNNFDYSTRFYFNPLNTGEGSSVFRNIADEGHPTSPLLNPDGTLSYASAYTVGDFYLGNNGSHLDRTVIRNTSGFEAKFLENKLRVIGNFNFQNINSDELRIRTPVPYSPAPGVIEYIGTTRNDIQNTLDRTNFVTANIYSEYETNFTEKNYFKAMVGYNYEQSTFQRHQYSRNELLFPTVKDVNLAVGDNVLASGGFDKWRIAGGFFRLNYIFEDRYLLEVNGRYDGSSKFPEGESFAFFPSISGAWRISQEEFWPVSEQLVSDLKFRASYGSLGNANINPYTFQEQFSIGTGIILAGARPRKTSMPAVLPDGLTWETATTSNIGLDLSMIEGKLNITGDAYIRHTSDMYTIGRTLPATFGTTSPRGNYADMKTKGWEAILSWRDAFNVADKPFTYNVRFNMADWRAEITRYNNPEKFLDDYYVGMAVGEVWGFVTEGFFSSEEDVLNHANQQSLFTPRIGTYQPGDIKLEDLNNDGIIDFGRNTVEDPGDRKVIGNSSPRYTYGLNLSVEWNSLFLSAFLQGVGRQEWYPHQETANFWGQYNRPYGDIPSWHLNDGMIWSEENPDSFLPRYVTRGGTGGLLRQVQSKYLMDASYIRLRNVQLGYNLPAILISKVSVKAARIFVSAENLWTYSPLYKILSNIDVENSIAPSDQMYTSGNSGDGYNYPMLKSVTIGLNVTF